MTDIARSLKIIGIDLGTTFSLVAEFNPHTKTATAIAADSGSLALPSAVYYPEDGEPVVGQEALNAGEYAGDRLVRFIKIQMGTEFLKRIGDRDYSPPEISAEILKTLKKRAESYFNIGQGEFDHVVITVPAYFTEKASSATKEAARLAGFDMDKVRLFAEPCAAAVAYIVENGAELLDKPHLVAVSDLGGGTYDASMVETKTAVAEDGRKHLSIDIVSKAGNQQLGGVLWDQDLEDYVKAQCTAAEGHSGNWDDASVAHALRERVIRAKELLSKTQSAKVGCCVGKAQDVDRVAFERETAGRLAQVEHSLRALLDDEQKRQKAQVEEGTRSAVTGPDRLLLAGGASNMPQVKQLVTEITGLTPRIHKSLEQIVALGAAYEAAINAGLVEIQLPPVENPTDPKGPPIPGEVVIVDPSTSVVTYNIGIRARNPHTGVDENAVVVKKGAKLDQEESRDDLTPADPNQTAVRFVLLEGMSTIASECETVGEVVLALPQREPDVRLRVNLKVGKDYIVEGRGIAYKVVQGEEIVIGDVPLRIKRSGLERRAEA